MDSISTDDSDSESHTEKSDSQPASIKDSCGDMHSKHLKRSGSISVLTMSSVLLYSLTLTSCSNEPTPSQTSTSASPANNARQLAQNARTAAAKKKKKDEEEQQQSSYHGGHTSFHGGHSYVHGGHSSKPVRPTSAITSGANGKATGTAAPAPRISSPTISGAHTATVAPSRGFFGWAGGLHFSGFGG